VSSNASDIDLFVTFPSFKVGSFLVIFVYILYHGST
jgi:hypothetical protein